MMAIALPFLSVYDPAGTGEGSLDPLGMYQIADRLAVQLVPAVRERMQRIRFLTAMAVGTRVVQDLEGDPQYRDSDPYLVWEWLVVEGLVRNGDMLDDQSGVPGTNVVKRAMEGYGHVDARGYLKTPRIFGFHGVYKRLAIQLEVLNTHLGPGPNSEDLVQVWARGMGLKQEGLKDRLAFWTDGVERSLRGEPPQTRPNWRTEDWTDLASAFGPAEAKGWEKAALRKLMLETMAHRLGALPQLWELLVASGPEDMSEEQLHEQLARTYTEHADLVRTIQAYERFARGLDDAFHRLFAAAQDADLQGFPVSAMADQAEFRECVSDMSNRYSATLEALGRLGAFGSALQGLFQQRFHLLGEDMPPARFAHQLCEHHVGVQRAKSAAGKRTWFDPMGEGRIYVRAGYRVNPRPNMPGRYVHAYRAAPIARFIRDLS